MAEPEAPKKKRCFVVGPIGPEGSEIRTHADWLFEGIIKTTFDGFAEFEKPIRADMIAQPGMITTQIIKHLLEDDLVIADLSLANPNAFYEIGIRHMAQKPIVHMQLKDEPTPFDTSGFRAIKFTVRHPSALVEARRELAAAIKGAIASDHRVENPVTHARGAINLEQSATPEQRVLLEEVRSINSRLNLLESKGGVRRTSADSSFSPARRVLVRYSGLENSTDIIADQIFKVGVENMSVKSATMNKGLVVFELDDGSTLDNWFAIKLQNELGKIAKIESIEVE